MSETLGRDGRRYVIDLPFPKGLPYGDALQFLREPEATDRRPVLIAHVDSGLAPHPGIGWTDTAPPAHILWNLGVNFHDPADPANPEASRPLAPIRRPKGIDGVLSYPDHGVKTLSALIGPGPTALGPGLRGVAPGARVIPYRVADGPLFRHGRGPALPRRATEAMGRAIRHALAHAPDLGVVTVSMGNPGALGLLDIPRWMLGGETAMSPEAAAAIDAAYEAGVITVCAGGQVVNEIVYPAKYARTVAVGGYDRRGADAVHYPQGGYRDGNWDAVIDVWAQAERINRAGYDFEPDGRPVPVHAASQQAPGPPSGTSYACPQVAGAAALWLAWWQPDLDAAFGPPGAPERWRVVESFRRALRRSALRQDVLLRATGSRATRRVRVLDIAALLGRPPETEGLTKAVRAVDQGPF